MKVLLLVGAVTCLHLVSSQQNQCTRENLEDPDVVEPLLASSLVAGTQSSPPMVDITTNYAIVCLSVDNTLNRYRGASLVVEYTCDGACSGNCS